MAETQAQKDARERPYHGALNGETFHLNHAGQATDQRWQTRGDAVRAGRRPCQVCQP